MPSTVVARFHYYPETSTLRIVFVTGMVYDYMDVPEKVYQDMKAAFSKGIFFNQHIKDKYSFKRVTKV